MFYRNRYDQLNIREAYMRCLNVLAFLLILGACACNSAFGNLTVSELQPETSNSSENTDLGTAPDNQVEPAKEFMGANGSTQPLDGQSSPKSARLTAQEANSRINLRTQPSAQSSDQGYGLVGDPIQILNQAQGDDGFTWYLVKFEGSGAEGWIRSDFVKIVAPTQLGNVSIKQGVAEAALLSSQQVKELVALDSFSRQEYDWQTFSPEYIDQANGNPYGIVLPTYVPPGFEITKFSVEPLNNPNGPGFYSLEYSNSSGQCFSVHAGTGGLGADSEEYQIVEVNSPALGRVKVGYTEFSQRVSAPEVSVWVSQGKMNYSFLSPDDCEQSVSFPEAAKIVESLNYLTPVSGTYPLTQQLEP
ncbi:hypothetical protein C8255_10680 [filamentous cyanobacterium CCP3]|nr:hypothetical protein C8255_10680 [filamentous cyanobacterium CCP3]